MLVASPPQLHNAVYHLLYFTLPPSLCCAHPLSLPIRFHPPFPASSSWSSSLPSSSCRAFCLFILVTITTLHSASNSVYFFSRHKSYFRNRLSHRQSNPPPPSFRSQSATLRSAVVIVAFFHS
ncbi:hypothetical protein GQ42DRAFT_630 [Ramicandelaber brevisporus]|nr:hypothetical protein GQ42DRAFT_630 [Ramicandelaber brevisporus]